MKKSARKEVKSSAGLSATFRCGACGKLAATATLVLPSQPDPRLTPEPEGVPPGVGTLFMDSERLSIDGGPASYTIGVAEEHVDRVKAALLAGSAARLFAADHEYAPFWCPQCRKCYCREHYESFVTFDECFYDATYGTCPRGHRRMLCD